MRPGLKLLRINTRGDSGVIVRESLDQLAKACGHIDHVGTCPSCQRAQLAKWQAQLAQVDPE
jgi:hypothetical protein